MVPPLLTVPSTLCTVSGCFNGLVPIAKVLMVQGSMKLWVAPQSRSASILVVLCHMFTVRGMVIEFFWVLYMLATVAGVLSTFKLWQTKNLTPCLWHPSKWLVLHLPWLPRGRESVGLW